MDVVKAMCSVGGAILGAATRALAAVRPESKPLHPVGETVLGHVTRWGSAELTGVDWIDKAGEDPVVVRRSRAIGLPRGLPDIQGVAVRIPAEGGDLLFASTGLGLVTRFILTACRSPRGRPLTTLLPYETDSGALLLAIDGTATAPYALLWARPAGPWHQFGQLHLSTTPSSDSAISFDPVINQIPGLRQYSAVRRLREPAYQRARNSRHHRSREVPS